MGDQNMERKLYHSSFAVSFENLKIETPDGKFPLIQIAQIIQKSPNMIVINMGATAHVSVNFRCMILNERKDTQT